MHASAVLESLPDRFLLMCELSYFQGLSFNEHVNIKCTSALFHVKYFISNQEFLTLYSKNSLILRNYIFSSSLEIRNLESSGHKVQEHQLIVYGYMHTSSVEMLPNEGIL